MVQKKNLRKAEAGHSSPKKEWKAKEVVASPKKEETPKKKLFADLFKEGPQEAKMKAPSSTVEKEDLGRSQGQMLLDLLHKKSPQEQHDVQERGALKGKELLRMVSAPSPKVTKPPQKVTEPEKQVQQLPCTRNQEPVGPTILATSPAASLAKPVLPFMAPPLLAGIPQLPHNQMMPPPVMQPPPFTGVPPGVLLPSAPPPCILQSSLPPPPAFTPRLPFEQSCPVAPCPTGYLPPHNALLGLSPFAPPIAHSSSLLFTGESTFTVPTRPHRASLPAQLHSSTAVATNKSPRVDLSLGGTSSGVVDNQSHVVTSTNQSREVEEPSLKQNPEQENGSDAEVPDGFKLAAMSRSNSESSINLGSGESSEAELDSFIPPEVYAGLSWEYPLSKSEKHLLYTRLCDQERAAAVHQYTHLKRRVSQGRVSMGRGKTCDNTGSQRSSNQSEGCNEEEQQLRAKERELERELQNIKEQRRLSRSRRLSGVSCAEDNTTEE